MKSISLNYNQTCNIVIATVLILYTIFVFGMPLVYNKYTSGQIFPPALPKTIGELSSVSSFDINRMEGYLKCGYLSSITSPRFPEDYQRAQLYCKTIQRVKDTRLLKELDEERMAQYKDVKIPKLKE